MFIEYNDNTNYRIDKYLFETHVQRHEKHMKIICDISEACKSVTESFSEILKKAF